MGAELQHFLWLMGLAVLGGLILGVGLRWFCPREMKQFAQASKKLRWYWYGLFGVMFTLLALASWSQIYFAVSLAMFAVFEFGAMVFAFARQRSSLPNGN